MIDWIIIGFRAADPFEVRSGPFHLLLTKPGCSKPHTHSNPTNLALFRRKIALYKFNQGGSYYCRGLKWEQGGPVINYWIPFYATNSRRNYISNVRVTILRLVSTPVTRGSRGEHLAPLTLTCTALIITNIITSRYCISVSGFCGRLCE